MISGTQVDNWAQPKIQRIQKSWTKTPSNPWDAKVKGSVPWHHQLPMDPNTDRWKGIHPESYMWECLFFCFLKMSGVEVFVAVWLGAFPPPLAAIRHFESDNVRMFQSWLLFYVYHLLEMGVSLLFSKESNPKGCEISMFEEMGRVNVGLWLVSGSTHLWSGVVLDQQRLS